MCDAQYRVSEMTARPFSSTLPHLGIQSITAGFTNAGSVTSMPPAIQPSSMPPKVMMNGKRSISLMTSWLPQTMIGIEISRPSTTSRNECSPAFCAAPAMAITLSTLITRSATMMVLMAASSLSLPCTSPWPSSSGASSFTPIHTSSSAPTNLRNGSDSRVMAKAISTTRKTMAPAVPQMMPLARCAGGSLRQASAITTALSPPSKMSMMMIWPSASQNSGEVKKSMKSSVS